MNKKEQKEKTYDAACKFLENKGAEILEKDYETDYGTAQLVALYPREEILVFIILSSDYGFIEYKPFDKMKRTDYEKIMMIYLRDNEDVINNKIRVDHIHFKVIDNKRALCRNHVNCFATSEEFVL